MIVTCVYKFKIRDEPYSLTFLTSEGWFIIYNDGKSDTANKVWTIDQLTKEYKEILYEQN